ncbi:MAG: DUF456 domain-containing protein [Chloroflexi bacterium]|nr:DUF456 domain-containing protein [Chloroflexota bacterium]
MAVDNSLLILVTLLLLTVGIAGSVVPGLPGLPLVLLAVYVYAFGTGFRGVGITALTIVTVLGLLAMALSYLGNLVGARVFGASRAGMVGALVGLLAGMFLFPPFGVLVGPLVGAVAGELLAGRRPEQALRGGCGALVGYLTGSLLEMAASISVAAWLLQAAWSDLRTLLPAI